MSREDFVVRHDYEGAGNLAEYSFDFKIEDLSQLLVIELNASGVETQRVRGDDTVYLSTVEYDAIEGGGTVTLVSDLTTDYRLILLLANDEPTQPSEFKDKFSFTLRGFEMALDWLGGAIQRLAYRMNGAVRLDDATDPDDFDTTLPLNLADYPGYAIVINADGDGLTLADSTGAEGAIQTEHILTEGQVATALTDEMIDSATYTSRTYEYEIIRGTTVLSTGRFKMHYRDSLWRVVMGDDDRDDTSSPHGVTIGFSGTTVAQLTAAVTSDGEGNGTIKLKKSSFTV